MEHTVVRTEQPPFTWLDVTAPTAEELHTLAARYGLHSTSVQDCLDPEHLPKFERFDGTSFLILRVHDRAAPECAGTVQELTRKIAIFSRPDLTITIHRAELPMVAELRERFGPAGAGNECTPAILLAALVNAALDSYDKPLQRASDMLDGFEEHLFRPRVRSPSLERVHELKRSIGLMRRMLWQTQSVLQRVTPAGERAQPAFQDLKENAESYYFWADQLHEEVTNLLSMHVAMASQRTNDVMRVLTVFSAFFLPLTFIVGVYGMNFTHMPELEQRWGYPAVLLIMIGVCVAIFTWFRRKGWLGGGDQ